MTNFWGPIVAAGMGVLLTAGLVFFRRLNKLLAIFEEFPPHRHIDGKILFPKDYSPGKVQAE